jgi:hypothetical protein
MSIDAEMLAVQRPEMTHPQYRKSLKGEILKVTGKSKKKGSVSS